MLFLSKKIQWVRDTWTGLLYTVKLNNGKLRFSLREKKNIGSNLSFVFIRNMHTLSYYPSAYSLLYPKVKIKQKKLIINAHLYKED